ncbi:xanthine dehydrogenase accessory protein XdhC [Aliiroseovarius sp. Z3]|uniref:xanthine dehydrogenase accessory protein XdhC n=1 Tax=Aliiroseovarius sp. Z3 TaxID=2811402 RepID=UPI0023B34F34|nr:xanthine dehydrogenase accessory protein XdhC [Aliiroseovarius sp. Z3]MDE9451241.1 xanthine dehydrogenase accessory protein XdhC [Aliiroseovarius sp. Z3]
MSFDLTQLADTIARHGPVARVVVADTAGSTPREVGAAMLVWQEGQSGTIGGGELEHRATIAARNLLASGRSAALKRVPLGPELGQCCGGAVTLLTECYTADDLAQHVRDAVVARPVTASDAIPLAVKRVLDQARAKGLRPLPQLLNGWIIEPLACPTIPVWIFGAGHVGRALVDVLSPLANVAITWVDTSVDRFPTTIPTNVSALPAPNPAVAARMAPPNAHHLILTYSHSLDLEICHAVLSRDFASAGLIGSATKWVRFRRRLTDLGHSAAQINTIQCPMGDPGLGKTPQAIAIGVAATLLNSMASNEKNNGGMPGDRGHAPPKRAIDT